MKIIPLPLALFVVGTVLLSGCSSTDDMGNADSRGANLNNPNVARNTSSGPIAASPDRSN